MSNSLLVAGALTALDSRGTCAEEVSIFKAPPRDTKLVDTIADVALPEPIQGFWGRRR